MSDPAAGKFEAPGGHIEGTEPPRAAAMREWQEETGLPWIDGEWTGTWTSANGIYQGFVYTIAREADLDIFDRQLASDPDGDVDGTETIAWWDPADLPGNPAVRAELLADIDAAMAALGCTEGAAGCCGGECCQGGCCGGTSGCGCGLPKVPDGSAVAKAAGLSRSEWPGWQYDLAAAEHWAPKVTAAVLAALPASKLRQIARDYLAAHPAGEAQDAGKRDLNDQATEWLQAHEPGLTDALLALIAGILADAYAIGAISASAVTAGTRADPGGWEPGDTDAAEARIDDLGLGDDYAATADSQQQDRAGQMAGGFLAAMGRALAGGSQQDADAGSLADSLWQAIDDHPLAAGLVLTVLTAVSAMAARAWYQQAKVEYGTWIGVTDERICPACLQNVQSDPVPIGQAYPSGDAFPPVHARCRCAVVPA